ncbi:hypothetical protein OROGR_019125 [Orobanche gracilis]
MVAKADRSGGCGAEAVVGASRRRRSFNKPSWLLCNIADLDERIKMVTRKKTPKENSPDSFAARANSYYHERPQLLQLLNDLYNNYLSLADRYCQSLSRNKHHHTRCPSPIPILKYGCDDDGGNIQPDADEGSEVADSSDAESSLSFQPPLPSDVRPREMDVDLVVADLVMKTVEYDIISNELSAVENKWGESSRKMELQKNLLDVLESERSILLNDNAALGYRVAALAEENKGLASESLFLKRKAAELARCVLKTREDRRVCMLSRKIEDLQEQIHGLEKRNKEYYAQLVRQEEVKSTVFSISTKSKGDGEGVDLEDCFRAGGGGGGGLCFGSFKMRKVGGNKSTTPPQKTTRVTATLWDKVKKFDFLLCGPHVNLNPNPDNGFAT